MTESARKQRYRGYTPRHLGMIVAPDDMIIDRLRTLLAEEGVETKRCAFCDWLDSDEHAWTRSRCCSELVCASCREDVDELLCIFCARRG
jgi:hypothetical protein